MKLKLDENFGRRCVDILISSGHDVATVAGQQMSGAAGYAELLTAVTTFAKAIETESIDHQLWIVEIGRIRVYRPEDDY